MNYYKITNKQETHNGLKYKTGLNTLLPDETFNPSGDCESGGIYFSREDILAFLWVGCYIRKVTFPKDTQIYRNPGTPVKWKADKAILGKRRKITFTVIKQLVENGADVNANDNQALRWAVERGHFKMVKYLIENGADVNDNVNDNYALRCAAIKGHLKIVKYLIENGADVNDKYVLRWAAERGHLKIVKYLIENGADANDNQALRQAAYSSHSKIVKYLAEKSH